MTMEHKAFVFRFDAFERDLAPVLLDALRTGATTELRTFVDAHLAELSSPYDGSPLPDDWERALLENRDVHEYGDVALTRYYDPGGDIGLGASWVDLDGIVLPDGPRSPILGRPFGPPEGPFDPGRMGSYFQSPAEVRAAFATLQDQRPRHPTLDAAERLLRRAVAAERGLYVTF